MNQPCFRLMIPALAIACCASLSLGAADEFNWMQSGAQDKELVRTNLKDQPSLDSITGTKIPKATADKARFTKEYQIDLKKFKISNDGTNPVETSKGINQALQDAKASGANRIVFPKGTYLISETDPVILDLKDAIIDLNGAIIQINTNGLQGYSIVCFNEGAENLRLTNGTVRGDKDTHDYKTIKGPHEGGSGVCFNAGRNLEMDNMVVSNCPGSGLASSVGTGKGAKNFYWISAKALELGELNQAGQKVASEKKLRTIKPYDISVCKGEFEFGYTLGYQGYPSIKDRCYQAYFYDEKNEFVKKLNCLQFRKVAIPEKAKFMHLEFNQVEAKDVGDGLIGRITNLNAPTDVHMHNNHIIGNRSLGMAFCGGQKWIIEDNLFEANGGNAPGFGIDFEDGWDLMQDVIFRNNKFKGNLAGDLVVCAGTEMIFEGNQFEKNVAFWDRVHNYVFRKNTLIGSRITFRTGISYLKIHDNKYENGGITMTWNEAHRPNVAMISFENETISKMQVVTGNSLKFANCKLSDTRFVAYKDSKLIEFSGCELNNSNIEYPPKDGDAALIIENCKVTLDDRPLVKLSAEKTKLMRLIKNVIVNKSKMPTLLVNDAKGMTAAAKLVLEDNQFSQASGTAILDGSDIQAGAITVNAKNNKADKDLIAKKYLDGKFVEFKKD